MDLAEQQAKVRGILEQNKRGTHLMSWGQDEDGAYVFPEIVQQQSGAPLVRLDPDKADAYAHQSGEMIRFPKKEDADWFSSNYKVIWPFMDR